MRKNRWKGRTAALLLLLFLVPLRALAAGDARMEIAGNGQVTLRMQDAARAGISSLQFSLAVEPQGNGDSGEISVEFAPDGSLAAEVVEAYWHADSGLLNVYVAGEENLFQSDSLTLGSVAAYNAAHEQVGISVSVAADSLRYVEGDEMREVTELVTPVGPVAVGDGNAENDGAPSGNGSDGEAGNGGTSGENENDSNGGATGGDAGTSGGNGNGNDDGGNGGTSGENGSADGNAGDDSDVGATGGNAGNDGASGENGNDGDGNGNGGGDAGTAGGSGNGNGSGNVGNGVVPTNPGGGTQGGNAPTANVTGNGTSSGNGSSTANGNGNGNGTSSSGTQSGTGNGTGTPTGDPANANEVGEGLYGLLESTLDMAEKLSESDYTEESYQKLRDAIEAAEKLLNDPEASREEIEEAILQLEDAMGALKPATDTSTDGTEEEPGDAQQGEAAGGSDAIEGTAEEESGSGHLKSTLLWVIVAAVVIALLYIGVYFGLHYNEKKKLKK